MGSRGELGHMEEPNRIPINSEVGIPLDELKFDFVRSSGPGGQHVNRSATQVELRFDVANSPSLTEEQRHRVLMNLRTRIDAAGVLHISAQSTRSQYRNRAEAVTRFQELMQRALRVPRRRKPTRPTVAARERRLEQKRRRSDQKRSRQRVQYDER